MLNKNLHFQQIDNYDITNNKDDLVLLMNGKYYHIELFDPSGRNSSESGV